MVSHQQKNRFRIQGAGICNPSNLRACWPPVRLAAGGAGHLCQTRLTDKSAKTASRHAPYSLLQEDSSTILPLIVEVRVTLKPEL
jgi:hypothetical protein